VNTAQNLIKDAMPAVCSNHIPFAIEDHKDLA
jgi:hypothetical protein